MNAENELTHDYHDEATNPSSRRRGFRGRGIAILCAVTLALGWVFIGPGGIGGGHNHGAEANAAGTCVGAVKPMTRTYYIAADLVQWNYAPDGLNVAQGRPFTAQENTYVGKGAGRIGSTYTKALYREYTDATFATLKPRPAADAYLGILGPTIRAQVGDTIKVVFKNNSSFPASVHPHDVVYTHANEGAPYEFPGETAADRLDDAVAPGASYTYTWNVATRSGPGPGDPSSKLSMYHSHTDEVGDTYSGLIGPMIITRAGCAAADGHPLDVDREIINLYQVWNENKSLYLDQNMAEMTPDATLTNAQLKDDPGFEESNLMHAINGYVFTNGPKAAMNRNTKVRWYIFSMGTEVDLHTPHVHGNVWTNSMGMNMDMFGVLPGEMQTLNMVPDAAGLWLMHCHVNDHITAGMISEYQVN